MRIGRLLLVLLLLCSPLYAEENLSLQFLDSLTLELNSLETNWKTYQQQFEIQQQSLKTLSNQCLTLESQCQILESNLNNLELQVNQSQTTLLTYENLLSESEKEFQSLKTFNTVLLVVVGVLGLGLATSVICQIV